MEITKEDIILMKRDINENIIRRFAYNHSVMPIPKYWVRAFNIYNENAGRKYGMGCYSCYIKVYDFVKAKIK